MSRSNNTEIISPVKRHFEWSGSEGCIKYFDKTKGEKGENILLKLPFTFLVLDRLTTMRGFSDADNSGIWSNEIRDLKKETLTVRTKKGIIGQGLYETLDAVKNKGAQYAQSVYIAYYDENKELSIGNLLMTGSSIGPWIDLLKGKDIYKYAVIIKEKKEEKKGATKFFAPVFNLTTVKPETDNKAIDLDKELQTYLKAYFSRNATQQTEQQNLAPEDVITKEQKEGVKELENEQPWKSREKGDFSNDGEEYDDSDLPF